jgi:hypothetical protein
MNGVWVLLALNFSSCTQNGCRTDLEWTQKRQGRDKKETRKRQERDNEETQNIDRSDTERTWNEYVTNKKWKQKIHAMDME